VLSTIWTVSFSSVVPHLTTREAMKRSLELLSQVHSAPILEVVLNAAESDAADTSTTDMHTNHQGAQVNPVAQVATEPSASRSTLFPFLDLQAQFAAIRSE